MRKTLICLFLAIAVSIIAFSIHVATTEWIDNFVAASMKGNTVISSWDVRYLAAITSIETGCGLVLLYSLIRTNLPANSSLARGLMTSILLLMVAGRLIRQPIMDLAIGNPLPVVLVQDGII